MQQRAADGIEPGTVASVYAAPARPTELQLAIL